MNNNFTSDFSLFPIKKMGKPGWEYRKATWASEMDSEVRSSCQQTTGKTSSDQ